MTELFAEVLPVKDERPLFGIVLSLSFDDFGIVELA